MSYDEQVERWVNGESVHKSDTDECCPDFSCCQPQLLAEKKIRVLFQGSDKEVRNGLLMGFLGACILSVLEGESEKVYIAGRGVEN